MTIGNRILLGFAVVTAMMVALGFYVLGQLADVRNTTDAIVSRDFAMLRAIDRVLTEERGVGAAQEAMLDRYLARQLGREGQGDDPVTAWRRASQSTETQLIEAVNATANFRERSITADRAEAWQRLAQNLGQAMTQFREVRAETERQIEAMQANDLNAVMMRQTNILTQRRDYLAIFDRSGDILANVVATGRGRVAATYEESQISVVIALVLAALVSVGISYIIRQSITVPLSAFMVLTDKVGRGDLTSQAKTGTDEIGRLGTTLNGMIEGLRLITRQGRETTENLNAAVAEIRASSQEQAASVEEQLAAVQETAATVDEITHSGAQIGKRAQEVIATAQGTVQTSSSGLRAAADAARAMDLIREQAEAVAENIVALSEKTQAIGEIISTVNDLSERSHLLALNAAIEAAAAGDSGRSFAVVAAEMKMLADQAKEATGQVRSILGDVQRGINSSVMLTEEAVKRVAVGKEQTDTTQRTIEEITERVQEGVETFQQIIASTNQQQLGIEQVMGALQNIRQGSQQTASGTRQMEMAAGNLSRLSEQLLGLTERYQL